MSDFTPLWTRSSYCASNTCLEVAVVNDSILVRDSKDLDQPHLRVSIEAWSDFCRAIASGEFQYS